MQLRDILFLFLYTPLGHLRMKTIFFFRTFKTISEVYLQLSVFTSAAIFSQSKSDHKTVTWLSLAGFT